MSQVKLEDFILKTNETGQIETKTETTKRTNHVKFEIEFCDKFDFIIKRTTSQTKKELVMILTQGQYYIKNKDESITKLTPMEFAKFTRNMEEDIILEDCQWLGRIQKGKDFADKLLAILEIEDITNAIKQNLIYITQDAMENAGDEYMPGNNFKAYFSMAGSLLEHSKIFNKMFSIAEETIGTDREELKKAFTKFLLNQRKSSELEELIGPVNLMFFRRTNIDAMIDTFGIGGLYDFIKTAMANIMPNYDNVGYYWRGSPSLRIDLGEFFNEFDFKLKNLSEWIVFAPTSQGYALDDFMQVWKDTLRMQDRVFGKIVDKYPRYMESFHKKLSYETRILNQIEIKNREKELDNKIHERSEQLKDNSFKTIDFEIKPAESRDEIMNVARDHGNCLASYIERYANGVTDIYFMRKNKSEYVTTTIEIRNGKLRQAYNKRNTKPSQSEMKIIENFCNSIETEFTSDYHPM